MDVVKSMDEIRINMKTMDNYLVKANDPEYAYALGLISKGICFVADASTGEFRFYPSRFIGYANNTMSKHECNSSKDGMSGGELRAEVLANYFRHERLPDCTFLPENALYQRTYGTLPEGGVIIQQSHKRSQAARSFAA